MLKLLFLLKGQAQFLLSISIFFGCYEHLQAVQAYNLFLKVIEAVNLIDFWLF